MKARQIYALFYTTMTILGLVVSFGSPFIMSIYGDSIGLILLVVGMIMFGVGLFKILDKSL